MLLQPGWGTVVGSGLFGAGFNGIVNDVNALASHGGAEEPDKTSRGIALGIGLVFGLAGGGAITYNGTATHKFRHQGSFNERRAPRNKVFHPRVSTYLDPDLEHGTQKRNFTPHLCSCWSCRLFQ